jgi:hypothetical protein
MTRWEGDEYQRRFDALTSSGVDVHGEATFVRRFAPRSVLDVAVARGELAQQLPCVGRVLGVYLLGGDYNVAVLGAILGVTRRGRGTRCKARKTTRGQ